MNTLIPFLALAICLTYVHAGQCPDKSTCPDGTTCCKLAVGGYGCCPYPSATCCSDGAHCCPNGYTCDVAAGKCTPKSLLAALDSSDSRMRTKIPAIKKTLFQVQVCPSGQTQCPAGCCPMPNAVCCSDNVHCCPNGYTCNPPFCTPAEIQSEPMKDLDLTKIVEQVEGCPPDETECSGGCCPLPDAVCCSVLTCCPHGKTCFGPFCIGLFDKNIKFPSIPLRK